MILTSKGKFAVMALVDIGIHGGSKPVKLSDIALRQNIDFGYLEQIFMKLRRADLVKSIKGPGGGYLLNADPDKLVISSILQAVEEDVTLTRCSKLNGEGCMSNKSRCRTHHLWQNVENKINEMLSCVSLYDVIHPKKEKVL